MAGISQIFREGQIEKGMLVHKKTTGDPKIPCG